MQSACFVSDFDFARSARNGNGEIGELPEWVLRFAASEGDAVKLGATEDYDR